MQEAQHGNVAFSGVDSHKTETILGSHKPKPFFCVHINQKRLSGLTWAKTIFWIHISQKLFAGFT